MEQRLEVWLKHQLGDDMLQPRVPFKGRGKHAKSMTVLWYCIPNRQNTQPRDQGEEAEVVETDITPRALSGEFVLSVPQI